MAPGDLGGRGGGGGGGLAHEAHDDNRLREGRLPPRGKTPFLADHWSVGRWFVLRVQDKPHRVALVWREVQVVVHHCAKGLARSRWR